MDRESATRVVNQNGHASVCQHVNSLVNLYVLKLSTEM